MTPVPKPGSRRKTSPAQDRAVYEAVMARDKGCIAPGLGAPDPCVGRLTREHVRPGGGAMGARRVTRTDAVVILCAHHHLDGWATSHKQIMRDYLAGFGPKE